jgi:cytochrome b
LAQRNVGSVEVADQSDDDVQAETRETQTVRVWDFPTRAFHWLLVLLIISAYLTRHYGDDELFWHRLNGYTVLTLIAFRIVWGFVGSSTARFTSFIRGPWTAAVYALDFARNRPRHFLGHNPLGGTVVIAMLAVIAFQGVTGLYSSDDALAEGPLVDTVAYETMEELTSWHAWNFDVLLLLIGLHIFANLLYLVWKKENLIKPMVTGRKERAAYEDATEARIASPILGIVVLAIAAAIVLGGIRALGGSLF